MNILVVDDNEQNCHLLQVFLARKGNAVVTAANGAEALEKARLNPPDLIITDILMPVMDGFSLCREWKQDERLRDIPLIFYTGTYADERDREFALGLGAARFIVKPEDLDNLLRTIQAVMAEQERGRLPFSPKTMQGDVVYLKEYNEALIRKLEDKMRQLEQTNRELKRDIVERKRTEEALRESEEHFRTLVEAEPDVVYVIAADGTLKSLSPAFERISGWPRADWIGKPFLPLIHPDDLALTKERSQQVLKGETPPVHRLRILSRTGDYLVGEFTSTPYIEQGRIVGVLGIARNITKRTRAEEALRRSETKFRTLYDSTSDAVMLLDLKGFFDCNQAALAIFGCATREEFCSKHPADVSPPMQPCGTDSLTLANRRLVTAMEQGSHHFEWMHKRADTGETFPADVLLSAMELDGKRVLQSVVRDITERKRAEEDMRASHEQYRALVARLEQIREEDRTRIARGIHDELGQELTGLKMDLRWMEHGLEDLRDPRVSPLLEKTMAATDLVDTAIRTVQRIAADLRPAVLDKLGLVAAVRRETSQFQQHSGIPCRVTQPEVDPHLPAATALACFRIFQEAMTNVARHAAATAVEVDFQTPPDGFVLEVRDNGKGFSSGLAEKAESLGLLGMRERARAVGGEVTVRPRVEGGTVVRLWIPKADQK
jgi:PAS domain S-box-containing protein